MTPRRSSDAVEDRVRDERIRQLFRHGPSSLAVSAMVAALLVWLVHGRMPLANIAAWTGAFAAAQALRLGLLIGYKKFPERATPPEWANAYSGAVFLAGCSWGLSALWLFPANDVSYQFFDIIICTGICAGASSTLSCVLGSYALFLLPTVLPPSFRMVLEPGDLAHVAGLCGILYCAAMLLIAHTNCRLLSSSLRLQFVNLELAQELEALATRDGLTGLPNRIILSERLTTALRRAARAAHDLAVVFVDCDQFKSINDTLGHAAGDEYLQAVAAALQSAVREVDTVARLGGDEFIVLLERCGDHVTVQRIVERIRIAAAAPVTVAGQRIEPRLSIGVSIYPGDGTDGETLIRQADEAMYAVKRSGGNNVRFYDGGNRAA